MLQHIHFQMNFVNKKNIKNLKRVQELHPQFKRIYFIFNETSMFQLLRKLILSIYHAIKFY